jgi:hypothetical protein
MFQFTGFPLTSLFFQDGATGHDSRRVSPFGYPRISASVQLPSAFRRLRALHRQLVPRHSPCTLDSLILCYLDLDLTSDRVLDALSQKTTMQLSKISAQDFVKKTCGKRKLYRLEKILSRGTEAFQPPNTSLSLASQVDWDREGAASRPHTGRSQAQKTKQARQTVKSSGPGRHVR